MATIAITGGAGRIATAIAPLLRDAGHDLRLLDLVPPPAAVPADVVMIASATDDAAVHRLAAGADLLLHLAAFPSERTWRKVVDTNIESTRVALDAARGEAVPVTVLASSVHAVGYLPAQEAGDRVPQPRPDTYYGVSKVVAEALGSLYADRFGMRVVSIRIMNFDDRPRSVRALSAWVSPADTARLVLACLAAPPGHAIVWGVSANARRTVSLEAGRAMGYEPRDDAEAWADGIAHDAGFADAASVPPLAEPLGGTFTDPSRELGTDWA